MDIINLFLSLSRNFDVFFAQLMFVVSSLCWLQGGALVDHVIIVWMLFGTSPVS